MSGGSVCQACAGRAKLQGIKKPVAATELPLGAQDAGRRLDRILRRILPTVPLGRIHAAVRRGEIRVGGRRRAGSYRVAAGDTIEVTAELATELAPSARPAAGLPRDLSDRVVYENEHLIALDKPAGTPVDGPGGLLARVRPYLEAGEHASVSFRAGPLHRLDRNTSGLILFPRSLAGSQRVSELLRTGGLAKGYLAVLRGSLHAAERWDDELTRDTDRGITRAAGRQSTGTPAEADGRDTSEERRLGRARSTVVPLATSGAATLVLVSIETGRTHQIRAQAAAHGHPLLGDGKYGGADTGASGSSGAATYLLRAAVIVNTDPDEIFPATDLCVPMTDAARAVLPPELEESTVDRFCTCDHLISLMRGLIYKDPAAE